jgi:hypothetical protein
MESVVINFPKMAVNPQRKTAKCRAIRALTFGENWLFINGLGLL